MRAILRRSLVPCATAVSLVAGGGVLAYAGWISASTSATFTVQAVRIPQVTRPTATMTIIPVIRWRGVRIQKDMPVHRYVVTRHAGAATRVVCTLPASRPRVCVDPTAQPGTALTYTVTATYGKYWVGADSEPSIAVTIPGDPVTPTVSGEPVASGEPVLDDPTASPDTSEPPPEIGDPLMTPETPPPWPPEPTASTTPADGTPTDGTPSTTAPVPTEDPTSQGFAPNATTTPEG